MLATEYSVPVESTQYPVLANVSVWPLPKELTPDTGKATLNMSFYDIEV